MNESSKGSKIALFCLCLFLDREIPSFYQQCNARDVENSKPIGHSMTTAMSVSTKSESSPRLHQPSVNQWLLPIRDFPVPSLSSVSVLPCVLMRESKFSWSVCGRQWFVGRRLSVQVFLFSSAVSSVTGSWDGVCPNKVFLFSSAVTSVGNCCITAAICTRRLYCLNVGKRVYNFKRV